MPRAKIGIKHCGKCGRTLPVSEFRRNKREKDGLQNYCKSCMDNYRSMTSDEEKRKLVREILDRLEVFREGDVEERNEIVRRIRKKSSQDSESLQQG